MSTEITDKEFKTLLEEAIQAIGDAVNDPEFKTKITEEAQKEYHNFKQHLDDTLDILLRIEDLHEKKMVFVNQ